jgi:predicted exporter
MPLITLQKSTSLFSGWCITILLCLAYLLNTFHNDYTFDSSILNLLPEEKRSIAKKLSEDRLSSIANQRIVFLLESNANTQDIHSADLMAENIEMQLINSQLFSTVIGSIKHDLLSENNAWDTFYQSKQYQLLTAKNRLQLQNNSESLVDEALGRLYSPLASILSGKIIEDPLQLFWQWQSQAPPQSPFTINNHWLTRTVDTKHYHMLTATLNKNAFDVSYQEQVLSVLTNIKKSLPKEMTILSSGLIFHAAHGATQAKREISTIGIGSFIGIFILLLFCFRSITMVLCSFVPIVVGCLIATTLSIAFFNQVHLITLAFGASLVGVAIDYPLHYFCAHFDATASKKAEKSSVLRRILPSLSLGLFSSILAYSAQGMAPFPGLRQMAFFSVIGLIGAWLTVICWMPKIAINQPSFRYPQVLSRLMQWKSYWPNISSTPIKYLFLIISILLISIVASITGADNIRLLQTSPASLLKQDHTVSHLLNHDTSGVYFVIRGENPQQLLQTEEALSEKLDLAIQSGLIRNFSATSRYVPSLQRQQENYSLIKENVYQHNQLADQLSNKGDLAAIAEKAKQYFEAKPADYFTPDQWLKAPISRLASHLWLGKNNEHYYSIITLSGNWDDGASVQLATLSNNINDITFVHRTNDLSQLLTNYRTQLSQWILIAYGLVFLLLVLRYQRHALYVIAAPTLASLTALSILSVTGSTITTFHLLALLLVLGIGLDASIFLYDTQHSPYTWLAVILSSITTSLAFGLLTLSSTPVLHYFGETVLWGILFVLVLTPCFMTVHTKRKHDI